MADWTIGVRNHVNTKQRGSTFSWTPLAAIGVILFLTATVLMLYTERREITAEKSYEVTGASQEKNQQTDIIREEVREQTSVDETLPARLANSQDPLRAQINNRGKAIVYFHTSENRDRSMLSEIGEALRTQGYAIPETRLARGRTDGDVRFFFANDRRHAEMVKSVVESELGRRGYHMSLKVFSRDGRKFEFAAPGKIELWLPPLSRFQSKPSQLSITRQG